jgi:hypothetical protein
MSDPTTPTAMDLEAIAPDVLETVSGGKNDDSLTALLSQITSSLKDLGYSHSNTSTTDMMLMMMVMMGGFGGGGGGGFYFHGGFAGGFGGCGPALPPPPIDCCPPCKGW